MTMLSARQARFVEEYLIDFNGAQAAIRAGYSENAPNQAAYDLLTNSHVMAQIEERQAQIAAKMEITQEWVLRRWKRIVDGDPTEIQQTWRVCCRHCWGTNFEFQWREGEYRRALHQALASQPPQPVPDAIGGFGFNATRAPNPECPECDGIGLEEHYVADVRKASASARALVAGIKKTKDGIEIKMRDQDAALKNIAQYVGMLVERKELTGRNGRAIEVANVTAEDLTDDQLAEIAKG